MRLTHIPAPRALTFAAALLGATLVASCDDTKELLNPQVPGNNAAFMQRYVALGNSITAGYQSGGINDSTQRRSYAKLIADAAGTRYAYASLAGRGCTPPITNAALAAEVFDRDISDQQPAEPESPFARMYTRNMTSVHAAEYGGEGGYLLTRDEELASLKSFAEDLRAERN